MAQKTHAPDPTNLGTGAGTADHDNGGWTPPVVPATGATAGAPGSWTPSGSAPPANAAGAAGKITASPNTAWTSGQYVQGSTTGVGGQMYWSGTAWTAGKVPTV